jgi:hypothetical protein
MATVAAVTSKWQGVQVFSATMAKERTELGEKVERWIRDNKVDVVETVVAQSSDSEYHCISITVFFNYQAKK